MHCANVRTITGFTSRSLRACVACMFGADYRPTQMSYDVGQWAPTKGTHRTRSPHASTNAPEHAEVPTNRAELRPIERLDRRISRLELRLVTRLVTPPQNRDCESVSDQVRPQGFEP